MVKVITYGTYDLLHYGHIRLLQRAKALGDYLIVGVTADDFDKTRGKINVKQSLMERIEAVKATGLADEIIVEEYEGQKIDDIRRYDVDIFTVGSDWEGKFDYLNEYCKVVYLPRTEGISSSEIRTKERITKLGIVCEFPNVEKFIKESSYVNGIEIVSAFSKNDSLNPIFDKYGIKRSNSYEELLDLVDAVYIASLPEEHYTQVMSALNASKHVLCETPIALNKTDCKDMFNTAAEKGKILTEANKTAYSTAYNRLLLLAKSGKIGNVISVNATCTSLDKNLSDEKYILNKQNSICDCGTTAMLPVFQILGLNYEDLSFTTLLSQKKDNFDLFTKIDFRYKNAVATVQVGKGVKAEGELIVSGTKGYIYVPAPWWKTDYFELRYENQENNRRYFYQLDGEGIRYEIVNFIKAIEAEKNLSYINRDVSEAISTVVEKFYSKTGLTEINL